jgi:hypothetical protein
MKVSHLLKVQDIALLIPPPLRFESAIQNDFQ